MTWTVQFRGIFGWLAQCLQLNCFRQRRHCSSSSPGCLSSPRDRLACEGEAQQNAPTAYLLSSLEDAEFQILLCELRYPPIRYVALSRPRSAAHAPTRPVTWITPILSKQ